MADPNGWTPVAEPQAAAGWTPVAEPPKAVVSASYEPWTVPWLKSKLYSLADSLTEGLPAAGATAGTLIGGGAGTAAAPGPGTAAGAIGGAGIGGMAGEALKQHVRRALGFETPSTGDEAAKEIAKQGAIQGVIQAATEGIGRFAPLPLKNAAVREYTQALKPTTAENKAITQDIVPEMIKRGIRGSTEDIEAQAAGNIQRLRPQVNAAYANVQPGATAAQSPVSRTLNALEGMKGKYIVDGEVVNPSAVNAIEGVQQIVEKHGNNISPQSLRKVKQIFDEAVSEAGGYTNADLTTNYSLKAQREAAGQIRNILHTASPEAAAVDKEISFWLDVQQVARATNLRRAGQEGGLLKTFSPLASTVVGAGATLTHGPEAGIGAAGLSMLGGYVAQAMKTPAWRATSAIMKDRLAGALARGDVQATAALLARFGVAVPEAVKSGGQPSPAAQP